MIVEALSHYTVSVDYQQHSITWWRGPEEGEGNYASHLQLVD